MKQLFRSRAFKISVGTVVTFALLFTLLPLGGKYYLTKWLVENGADSASVKSLRYNPFLGRLTLDGVETKKGENELFQHASLVIDLGITSLFKRDIRIERVDYRNAFIDLEQLENGSWRYGSYTMQESSADTSPEAEAEPDGAIWGFLADNVGIENCRIHLKTSDVDMVFTIEQAALKRFTTRAEQQAGTFSLAGSVDGSPVTLQLDIAQLAPELRIDGNLKLSGFNFEELALLVKDALPAFAGKFGLDGTIQLSKTAIGDIQAAYQGTVTVDQTAIGGSDFSTAAQAVTWDGGLSYTRESGNAEQLGADGLLAVRGLNLELPSAELALQNTDIDLNGKTSVSLGDSIALENKGLVSIKNLVLKLPGYRLTEEKFNWQGLLRYDSTDINNLLTQGGVELEQFSLQSDGETPLALSLDKLVIPELQSKGTSALSMSAIETETLQASIPGALPVEITIPKIRLVNIVTEDMATFSLASLSLKNLEAVSTLSGSMLAQFDTLKLQNITTGLQPAFSAAKVDLGQLSLLTAKEDTVEKTFLTLSNISLSTIGWSSESGLEGDTLHFTDLVSHIIRDQDGEMNFSSQLQAMQQPVVEQEEKKDIAETSTEKGKPAPIRFREISIGGNSNISFIDQTLTVPYSTSLEITKLLMTDLDSTRTEKQVQLQFEGGLEKRAPLMISGYLSPFQEKPAINIALELKNYPLSSLSPYTVQSVGTALAGGQLKIKSQLALADDTMDLKNNVFLEKLKTETLAPELAAELDNQLPIPLGAALAMLRDSDKNIKLNIPVSGPVSDINVGISDVIITALNKSIVSAASSYFVYTLGPYAALAYVGMKVGEHMLQVNLPPVVFQPQEKSLTVEHAQYLERIAQILKDRPETDLQLHPRVASWEFYSEEERTSGSTTPATDEKNEKDNAQLLELGQLRAEEIQNHLVTTYSIEKKRLLITGSGIEVEKNVQPLVMLEVK